MSYYLNGKIANKIILFIFYIVLFLSLRLINNYFKVSSIEVHVPLFYVQESLKILRFSFLPEMLVKF